MSASNRSYLGPRENGVIFANGSLRGTSSYSINTDPANVPRQQIIDAVDHASEILPSNWVVQINPGGGNNVSESMSKHPNGWALDLQLISSDGTLHTPDSAPTEYSDLISALVGNALLDNKHAGIGMYNWGIHFDLSPARQTGTGDVTAWNYTDIRSDLRADPSFMEDFHNTVGVANDSDITRNNILNSGVSQGRQRAENGERSIGQNILADGTADSKTDPSVYSSNEGNNLESLTQIRKLSEPNAGSFTGQQVNGATISSLASLRSNNGIAINAELDSAIDTYESSVYPNIWKDILEKLDTGDFDPGSIPVGTGSWPSQIVSLNSSLIEDIEDLHLTSDHYFLTGKLLEFTRTNISHVSPSDKLLSDIIERIANKIVGDGNVGKFVKTFLDTVNATESSVNFGLALQQLEGQVFGKTQSTQENPYSSIPGMIYESLAGSKIVDLIGDPEEKLKQVVETDTVFNTFGSLYKDYNGLTTLGFGSLSSNLPLLGDDFITLGRIINFQDLIRMGKPGQILERILLSDCTVVTELLPALNSFGINLRNVNTKANDSIALKALTEIQTPSLIEGVFECFGIQRSIPENLGKLCDPEWQFAKSYQYNNFKNLNEISVHLITMGITNVETSAEFGNILINIESVTQDSALDTQSGTITGDEIAELRNAYSPLSDYSGDNNLTVSDFLGTAAGYRHNKLLPILAKEINRIASTSNGVTYRNLLEDLLRMLNGIYAYEIEHVTDNGELAEPRYSYSYTYVVRYNGVDYISLDNAVTYLIGQLETAFTNVEGELTSPRLNRYQSYQTEILHQLYKEQELRSDYGIGIGSSVSSSNQDILNFALNLEGAATVTGHGRQADFIYRVTSTDYHGGRIRSTMAQSRNKKFLEGQKVKLENQNTLINDVALEKINYMSDFVKTTGMWSTDADRSSEVFLQLNHKVKNRYEYTLRQIKQNQSQVQNIVDNNCINVLRQLMFVSGNNVTVTAKFTGLYNQFSGYYNNMHTPVEHDYLKLNLNSAYTTNGYVLGPLEEIIREFGNFESMPNEYIGADISEKTQNYINELGLNMKAIIGLTQKILLVNSAGYLGVDTVDYVDLFGIPSVSKYLLTIVALGI